MGSVMVLPGCMGSQLQLAPNVSTLQTRSFPFQTISGEYWADRVNLAAFGLDPMALDGTVQGGPSPGAQQFYSSAALDDYYASGLEFLKYQLKDSNWANVFLFPFDWRQSMALTAQYVANQIKQSFTPETPVILVGHSMGGLIARLAYRLLLGQGKANLIRRIICLGTPHQGTYRVWQAWTGRTTEGWLFSMLAALQGSNFLQTIQGQLTAKVIGVMMTWPSFYELLPFDPNDGSDESKFVKTLYTKDFWFYGGAWKQELRDNALQATQAFLKDGTSIPPARKLVCIEGFGFPTIRFKDEGWTSLPGHEVFDLAIGDGDGTVRSGTGFIEGGDKYQIPCSHDQLFKATGQSGLLAKIIMENFDPAPTAVIPPVQQAANPVIQQVTQAPPFADIPGFTPKRGRGRRR